MANELICIFMIYKRGAVAPPLDLTENGRGVASGTASRALALLDFWLAGPIKPTFQGVFLASLLDYWLAGAII